ncbi:MAG TPA: O-antigen ligase family protein [Thermoanaerobaculia bacterium]|nr:O-antigen ligase family protein [Thermoanaerobaculia bacterium]
MTSTLREYGLAAALTLATAAAMRWRSSLLGLRWGLLVAGTLIATLTVLQLLSDRFAPDVWGFARVHEDRLDPPTPFRRAGGPYGDANFYAQALLPVLALSVEASTSPASLATRAFGALASGTTATALAASLSRGALLGAAAMAAVSWPASRRRRGLAVGALVVGVVLLSPARERFAGVFRAISEPAEAEGAIRGRASEMTVAWQMLRDHPLIGVGPGNYQHHYLLYAPPLALDDRGEPRRAHSLYLEVAAESGLLGLALFSAILGGAVAGSWRAGRALAATDPEGARIAAALALGAGGYLVAGFFLHLQFPLPLYLLVGAGWGLMPSERTR